MLAVYPLIEKNGYEKILEGKASFFFVLASMYLVVFAIFRLLERGTEGSRPGGKAGGRTVRSANSASGGLKARIGALSAPSVLGIVMLAAFTVSWLISGDLMTAFLGTDGRFVGYFMLALCVACFFAVREGACLCRNLIYVIGAAGIVVYIISVFNHLGFNPLWLCDTYDMRNSHFISTLGNRNTMAAFIAVSMGVAIPLFLREEKGAKKRFWGFYVFAGYMAVAATCSDSVFLALAVVFGVTLCTALRSYTTLLRWGENGALIGIALLLDRVLRLARGRAAWKADGLVKIIFRYHLAVVWLVIMLLLCAFCIHMMRQGKVTIPKAASRIAAGVMIAVVVVYVAALVVMTAAWRPKEAKRHLGKLYKYLYFGNKWGTNRGRIWRGAISVFSNLPLANKIFGYGMGMSREAFSLYDSTNAAAHFDGILADAHCEYLQYLITTGIAGCAAFIGFIVAVLRSFVKAFREGVYEGLVGICLVGAFAAQALVNNTHIYIEPVAFILMGLILGLIAKRPRRS